MTVGRRVFSTFLRCAPPPSAHGAIPPPVPLPWFLPLFAERRLNGVSGMKYRMAARARAVGVRWALRLGWRWTEAQRVWVGRVGRRRVCAGLAAAGGPEAASARGSSRLEARARWLQTGDSRASEAVVVGALKRGGGTPAPRPRHTRRPGL
ncbi:hypothetical protein EYF80_063184 [Liparis tanakae]|uniref:Uncharacterized protein n=1 Tax=Liparis tanakae TaxID=230148 RepID=A0A4Z2EDP6_9TELE|nr:hypothetical protein EYF80_063184 [Liparis tanakae]